MSRKRDIGRQRAYRAEGEVFGGHWYEAKCRSPLIGEQEAIEMHKRVSDFFIRRHGIKRRPPPLRFSDTARGSYHSTLEGCVYRRDMLRECVVLHEVAHWAAGYEDAAHGPKWQRMYAEAIAEFAGADLAAEFLRLCQELPIMQYSSRPKRKFRLEEWDKVNERWIPSSVARKSIPNWQRLQMWRGRVQWVGPRMLRMIEE